jgi:hypothetical protein
MSAFTDAVFITFILNFFFKNERQRAVVDAFKHAWRGYRTYAWGRVCACLLFSYLALLF